MSAANSEFVLLRRLVLALAIGTSTLSAQDIDPASDPNVQPYPGTPVNGYILNWSDEFSGTAVDTNKWNFRTGVRLWSTQLPANNSLSNGLYYLHVKKETVGTTDYTAGGIISKALRRYGYYETRMRVPPGRGWHTSFWMMYNGTPTNNVHIELDVLENDSVNLFKYGVNTHRHQPTPHVTFGNKNINTPDLNAGFHVLGCEFTPTQIRYFFDGAVVQTVDATQFPHNDMNIWLTSVAANLGGTTNVDDSMLPNVAEYEYARYFVLAPTGSVSIVNPTAGGVTLVDTNTALRVTALASSSDTNVPVSLAWSKLSGPGNVTFANATNADTTATFFTNGSYVLQCRAVVGTSSNVATVNVSVAAPVSVALRQGVTGYSHVATFIRGDSVNWNSGGRDQFIVGRWNGQPLRPLLSFDLSTLDTNAIFQSATLDVWTDDTTGTGSVGAVELRKLNPTPTEGTGDGSSESNGAGTGATWLSRTGGTNVSDLWTNAGGDFGTNVLSSIAGYDATVANVQKTFPSSTVFVAEAQAAFNTGQPLNLVMISPETESGTNNYLSRISSDDNATVDQRPQLTLTFMGNFAPGISPGVAPPAMVGVAVSLAGVVSNASSSAWSKVSGPGTVIFGDAAQPATTAMFSVAGNHVLRLSGSNALAQTSRDLAVQVVPFARPQATSVSMNGGQLQFQVNGAAGFSYTVQASTNMLSWTNLFTTNAMVMPFSWSDGGASNFPARFYRVILQ
jgi:beta-glucanase (GH16 family)